MPYKKTAEKVRRLLMGCVLGFGIGGAAIAVFLPHWMYLAWAAGAIASIAAVGLIMLQGSNDPPDSSSRR